MIKGNQHISDDSIPEGLEFRQEYLDAALGTYRRTRAIMLWRKVGIVCVIAGIIIGGASSAYFRLKKSDIVVKQQTEENQKLVVPETKPIREESHKNSPSDDLEKGDSVIKEQRPSPAVESVKSSQDRPRKATGMGGSTSSGVELPGQLSHHLPKVTAAADEQAAFTEINRIPVANSSGMASAINNHQESATAIQENQGLSRHDIPNGMLSLPLKPLERVSTLADGHPKLPLSVKPWSLFASIGAKVWADYGFNARPIKPDAVLGLGVNYTHNATLSADLQAQFFTISGVAAPYSVTQKTYGTGFNQTTYRYFTDRLYETGALLRLKYHLSEKHGVAFGVSASYLLTADNHIETGVSSNSENPSTASTKAKGYVQGFQSLHYGLNFGYEYALGKSKSVGMNYQWGLTDITKKEYFGNANDRNSMISLYFRIKLIP
jgi:hypothetical protein